VIGVLNDTEVTMGRVARKAAWIDSPEFYEPDTEQRIVIDLPQVSENGTITGAQQIACFRMMNFLKFRAFESHADSRIDGFRELLINSSLPLVQWVVTKYFWYAKGADRDRLVSDGEVSLVRCVDLFDYRCGVQFGTYATSAIRRACWAGVKLESKWRRQNVCLATKAGDDDQFNMIDSVADFRFRDPTEAASDEHQVTSLLKCVHPEDKEIIASCFGLFGAKEMTCAEIAERMGVSGSWISARVQAALARMRGFRSYQLPCEPAEVRQLRRFLSRLPQRGLSG
jgi:RNA polymerase sigma factor (sigma-70 family)